MPPWPLLCALSAVTAGACSPVDVHPIMRGFPDATIATDATPRDGSQSDASPVSGTILWVRAIGGTGSETPGDIAVGTDDSLLLTGAFEESVTYDGASLTSAGQSDIYVLKLERDGSLRWARRYGGTGPDRGHGVAATVNGGSLVTGIFSDQVDFGSTPLTANGGDGFVLALDGAGTERFAAGFGAAFNDVGHDVAPSPTGGSVVVGAEGLGSDVYAGGLDASGQSIWEDTYSPTGGMLADDGAETLAIDQSGRIFIAGFFQFSIDAGGTELLSAGGSDIFVSAIDASGTPQWARSYGGAAGFDAGRSLALADSGRLYLAGEYQAAAQFGAFTLSGAGIYSAFVTEISPTNGDVVWAKSYGGTAYSSANTLAVGGDGRLFVSGRFIEDIDFGATSLKSTGGNDIFVARLDAQGEPVWASSVGGAGHEREPELALGPDGTLYLIGSFEGTAGFGEETLTSAGASDAFLIAIAP